MQEEQYWAYIHDLSPDTKTFEELEERIMEREEFLRQLIPEAIPAFMQTKQILIETWYQIH